METASKHILCVIYALLSVFCLQGQTTGAALLEKENPLNRYELACEECMALKTRVNSGESVSKKEASETISRFVNMNAAIRSSAESLNPKQKARFEAINIWFATGQRPLVLDHTVLPEVPSFSPIRLKASEDKGIDRRRPTSRSDSTEIPADTGKVLKTHILATVSLPDASYGAMFGMQYGKWGGYIRAKSNFRSHITAYSCLSDGTLENGRPFWPGGDSRKSDMTVSAGIMYGITGWMSVYGGLGYGYSILDWNDIDGNWARVKDRSFKGIAAEAGLLASWKWMTIGLGVSSTAFRTISFDISLGISF